MSSPGARGNFVARSPRFTRTARHWALATLRDHFGSLARAAATLVSVAVILNTCRYVARYHDSMAFWDFWNWIEDYRRFVEGQYHFLDLFNFHNEHRIFTTRLVLFADAMFCDMNGWLPLVVNLLLLAALGAMLHLLARRPEDRNAVMPCLFFIAATLSICSVNNLIGPFQVQFALTLTFVTGTAAALALATRPTATPRHAAAFLALGVLCFCLACFSMAGGMLAAPSMVLLLLLRRAKAAYVLIFAASASLAVFLYLHDFQLVTPRALPLSGQGIPLFRLKFVLRFLGGALGAYENWPTLLGAVLLFAAAAVLALQVWQRWGRGEAVRGGDAALIAISFFVVANAAAAAAARAGEGMPASVYPRYAILSVVIALCITALVAPRLAELSRCREGIAVSRARRIAGAVLVLTAIGALILINSARSYTIFARTQSAWLASVGQALRANADDGAPFNLVSFRSLAEEAPTIRFLRAHRLNMFAPLFDPPAWVGARLRAANPTRLPRCAGTIDQAVGLDATRFMLSGWLADAADRRTADWVGVVGPDAPIGTPVPADIRRSDVRNHQHMKQTANGFRAGFASTRPIVATQLWLVGLFAGDPTSDCAMPAPAALTLAMIQKLPPAGAVSLASLAAPTAMSAAFVQGAAPGAALPMPWSGSAFVSTSAAGDTARGRVDFAVRWSGQLDQALFLPFATGPDQRGQDFAVTFADGTKIAVHAPDFQPSPAWRAFVLPGEVIRAHGGGIVRITATDAGTGPNQWLAVAAPVVATARPDAARLY